MAVRLAVNIAGDLGAAFFGGGLLRPQSAVFVRNGNEISSRNVVGQMPDATMIAQKARKLALGVDGVR